MEIPIEYLHEISFEEIKDYKLIMEDNNGIKSYITIECLFNIISKETHLRKFKNYVGKELSNELNKIRSEIK